MMSNSSLPTAKPLPVAPGPMRASNICLALITCASLICALLASSPSLSAERARALGLVVGTLPSGPLNAITDVRDVKVGHIDLVRGTTINTGVTAILPHAGNLFLEKVPAAVHVYNAFGKAAGFLQVQELGELETPIVLTNTLSVGTAIEATVRWTLDQPGNSEVRSVNAVVGETNDGFLNDIRGQHVRASHVIQAIDSAHIGAILEGSVGAGVGTRAFGFKGGIGTASRVTSSGFSKSYTVGVLVQANYGRTSDLRILGIPVGERLARRAANASDEKGDGSCMIIIATDAPLDTRNLERLARRAFNGMARTTAVMSNGSGDFSIAFSTAYRLPYGTNENAVPKLLSHNAMTPLFQAVEEATEEAIYNALFMARSMTGHRGEVPAIPLKTTLSVLEKRQAIQCKNPACSKYYSNAPRP